MKRSPLRRSDPTARASVPVFKPKKCAVKSCRTQFTPGRSFEVWCSPSCGLEIAQDKKRKAAEKAALADRRETRAKLEARKGVPKLKKEAQEAFNRYVRVRDNGGGCFVCGEPLQMGGVGGGFDAGHIRSRSNADNLRFDERNVHGQCKPCNAPGATKDWQMRAAADRLLGKDEAEALYNDNAPIKWTRDGLREIRDKYRALTKELTK
jgi:hypothetical protein